MRGAPGVGKSTFVKENNLEQYTLCADNIRLLCQSPVMTASGKFGISQDNEKKVWSLLFQILKARMQRGETDFYNWYTEVTDEDYLYEDKEIEGFVVEDNVGYMVKLKLYYYKLWKHMRSVAHSIFRSGYYRYMGSLLTPLENQFYGFVKELAKDKNHPTHIMELRDLFFASLNNSK